MKARRKPRGLVFSEQMGNLASKIAVGMFTLAVVVQYVRIIDRNFVVAHQVHQEESVIRSLQEQTGEQQRHIARLERNGGPVPEIHDRLHLVAPGEAVVYLRHEGDGSAQTFGPSTP